MLFINEFFLFILYLVVFIISYLSFERFLIWKKIAIKYEKQVSDFALGSTMGVITLLMQVISQRIISDFSISLFIIGALTITFFKNFIVGLYSIIVPLIFMVVEQEITYLMYVVIILFFVSMITLVVFMNLFKNFISLLSWYVASIIFALVGFLISGLVYSDGVSFKIFKKTLFPYLLMIFAFLGFSYSTKVVTSSRNLYESSNFVFGKYYRSSLALNAIGKIIDKEKINFGAFIIFEINFIKVSDQNDREIEETILEKIENALPKNSVQFDASDGRYGFFSKIIDHSKYKYDLENIFNSLPNKLKTISKKMVDVNVKAAVSFYGKDSNSLNELSDYSNFTLNYSDKPLAWFEYLNYRKWIYDNWSLNLMDNKLQLDNFANYYQPIIDVDNFKRIGFKNEVRNISEFSFVESIDQIVNITGWKKEFDRYFALDAIKNAKSFNIFVEYSPIIFEDNFNMNQFILNIQKNIYLKNTGLIIREKEFKKVKNIDLVNEYLKKLSLLGITLIFENEKRAKGIDNYYFIASLKNKKEILFPDKTILEDVNTEQDFIDAHYKKVKFISGSIVPAQISFSKFNKQSKIYLETILKRKVS